MAWSDRDWILDGAAVHVSIVGFDTGLEREKLLDGASVNEIATNLRSDVDTTGAGVLLENAHLSFMGSTKGGPFDLTWQEARALIADPNPIRGSNADVVRPWVNGMDLTRRLTGAWIIDFGDGTRKDDAACYESPFKLVEERVLPERQKTRQVRESQHWWLHVRTRRDLYERLAPLPRFLGTARVAKYRLFVWLSRPTLPDCQVIAFARGDDYFFGVLHSSIHELWARRMGTQLREAESGFRYTPTTCFETFPLPWPPGKEPADHPAYKRIVAAAKELNERRERWLNPPEWLEPLERKVDAADDFADVPEAARPLLRHSAVMALAAKDARLKKRTLTNLYNERPTWLKLAHEALDRAVLAAYAATDPDGGWSEDWAAGWTETGAGTPLPEAHSLAAERAKVDQRVLTNLLRLNESRQSGRQA